MSTETIAQRLARVRQSIEQAARQAGRDPNSVTLVAVSKTKPVECIREAYEAGQRDFGENYVQELQLKADALKDLPGLRWHLIGHLQTNKVKRVAPVAHLVHSVDSEALVKELARRAEALARRMPVLVEINVGAEASKTGVAPEAAGRLVDLVQAQGALALRGLMTIPPFTSDPADSRLYFERLRKLRDELGGEERLPELSMGMSHDYGYAIASGATLVRVGTAIFGERG